MTLSECPAVERTFDGKKEQFTMHINRDEYMLLSRRGSVPPATRAGPRSPYLQRYDPLPPAPGLRSRVSSAVGGIRGRLSGSGPEHPSPTRSHGYVERESYMELEFAVGFGVEDEPWL
jgi:hypothetical protein